MYESRTTLLRHTRLRTRAYGALNGPITTILEISERKTYQIQYVAFCPLTVQNLQFGTFVYQDDMRVLRQSTLSPIITRGKYLHWI